MRRMKGALLILGTVAICLTGFVSHSGAEVNVGIHIGPPAYVFHAPPPVVVIPRTYVYTVPDVSIDILFHGGYWWRPYGGGWYRSHSYNGPWKHMAPAYVPRAIIEVPYGHYRHVPPGHQKVPYGQLKKNWKKWEREKHWSHDKHWHDDRHWDKKGNGHRDRDDRDYRDDRGRRDYDERGKNKHRGRGRDD